MQTDGNDGSEAVKTAPVGRRREDRIVGASQATRDVVEQATAASRSELPVLILGPSGSDKELVARAIHSWSTRGRGPFEAMSCVSVPEALQGRELFGCAQGVYPAVPGAYEGAFSRAGGGTLFLEQIEGLSPAARNGLVRAAGDGSFKPEGETQPRPLGARIICAGSADSGSPFGEIPHHEICLLPLAKRGEDVLPLAAHYLGAFSEEAGVRSVGFTADARACLLGEEWTGDVLELRERIRQAVKLAGQGAISAEALILARDSEDVPSFKEAKRAFETRYVVGLLRRCGGNISRAARLAKKDRKDFYDVIRRTGVDPAQFR